MNIYDLTIKQLKRAVVIKQQIERLNRELRSVLDAPKSRAAFNKVRTMSTSARRKIAEAQKARWASLRRAGSALRSAETAAAAKAKTMSRAARAKLSAKMKAYWAAKKAKKK